MELHHLHVAQRQARRAAPSPCRRRSCRPRACGTCTSSGRRRSRAAPPGPARRRTRRRACRSSARRRSRAPSAVFTSSTARCSSSRPMPRAQTCSASRLMISMPVRSPLCTVRSKVWPANAFWCTVPSGCGRRSSRARSRARACARRPSVTSVQARSWSESHLPPSIVSMKWRSTESPAASATL